jgi:hypothetical protein
MKSPVAQESSSTDDFDFDTTPSSSSKAETSANVESSDDLDAFLNDLDI